MKRRLYVLAVMGMLAFSCNVNAEEMDSIPLKEAETDTASEDYFKNLLETELYDYKVILTVPTAYDSDQWSNYVAAASMLENIDPEAIGEQEQGIIQNAVDMRASLTQIKDAKDCMWYIWGEDMPVADEESLDFTGALDNEDFSPFLLPYLVEDQSQAKGNLIVVSGGGYSGRANSQEGYPVAVKFNELGYNCFVLQRRVAPYSKDEIWSDLQRSVRYLRANIEEKGLGGGDCIAAAGFSGGSATILGAMANYYGDIVPDYDADYTPDEIDQVNSDLDIAILVYGPNYNDQQEYTGLETENTNLPACLLIAGADDAYGTADDNMTLYQTLEDKTTVEMYTFAYAPHGFGAGMAGTNTTYWSTLADSYMQLATVIENDDSAEVGENAEYGVIPEKYTKMQNYTVNAAFGAVDITLAESEDGKYFIIYFNAFGDDQVLCGINLDGQAVLRYDRTGFFGSDIQSFFDGRSEDAWSAVE